MGAKKLYTQLQPLKECCTALRIEVFTSTPAVARALDAHPVTSFKSDQAGQGRCVARTFGTPTRVLSWPAAHDGEVSGGQLQALGEVQHG